MKIVAFVMMVGVASAFAPMTNQPRAVSSLQGAFDGTKFDVTRNPYARGGKESWEFERDTMYVEEPKPKKAPVKKAVVKKAPVKKIVAKKAPVKKVVAKKAPAKKVAAKKSPAFSLFGKKPAPEPVKAAPKNPLLALFQK